MDVAELLAARIEAIAAADLSEVAPAAKLRLTDGIAVMVSGARTPVADLARRYVSLDARRSTYDTGGVEAFPDSRAATLEDAGFLSGCFAFAENYADTSLQSVAHPGSVVVPAVLVGAQVQPADGESILRAIAAGYEVLEVAARALNNGEPRMGSQLRGFRPTASSGAFGVVAALAVLWRLPPDTIRNALGVAADYAGGLRRHVRHEHSAIRVHSGETVRGGIAATLLAMTGLRSHPRVFEDPGGFLGAYQAEALDAEPLAQLDGPPQWYLRDTCLKMHCGPHTLMAALDALLELRPSLRLDDVSEVRIRVPATHTTISARQPRLPTSAAEAAASYEFGAAVVLATGEPVWPEQLSIGLDDPRVQRLFSLVNLEADESLSRQFAADPTCWPAAVEVEHRQGDAVNLTLDRPAATGSDDGVAALAKEKLAHCLRAGVEGDSQALWKTISQFEEFSDGYAELRNALGTASEEA